jgi:signal transduction histidine kinase/CheY-like chemotaxis protein
MDADETVVEPGEHKSYRRWRGRKFSFTYWMFLPMLLGWPVVGYFSLLEHGKDEALREAQAFDVMLSTFRSYYTTNVAERILQNDGHVHLSSQYSETTSGVPIPATTSIELGRILSGRLQDVSAFFGSDTPFTYREPTFLDDFQSRALSAFRENPVLREFSSVEPGSSGGYVMRFATPVIMEPACVTCHNQHPASPKLDWAVGDVRGIEETSVKLGMPEDMVPMALYLVLFILITALAMNEYTRSNRRLTRAVDELERQGKALTKARMDAEKASQVKSEFLATISHEIRTPMNAVLGMTHLMLKSTVTEHQRGYLRRIESSGKHLISIINDVLDLSKIEAGELELDIEEFELDILLNSITTMILEKANAKGLEVVFDVDPEIPLQLRGDATRLGQILLNYLSNAVKFTEHGEVLLRVRILERTGARILVGFEVHDTGIGITKEQQWELFQPFRQVDASVTRKFGGTGLGLSIAKRLATAMGGGVAVQSTPGQGSMFSFTAWIETTGEPVRDEVLSELMGHRALVVDDNPRSRSVLLSILKHLGLEVTVAGDGAAGLASVAQAEQVGRPFSIIFLDERMPMLDGLETARLLEERGLAAKSRRVLLTHHERAELGEIVETGDFQSVLAKPLLPCAVQHDLLRMLNVRLAEPLENSRDELERQVRELRGTQLLVVEDNEINQAVARGILEGLGLEVTIAGDGSQAVELIRGGAVFDLVLMDVQMPVMDGFEATHQIRKLPGYTGTPIVAMTANAMDEDRQRCLAAGMNDFLGKPIQPEQLYAKLLRWVRSA